MATTMIDWIAACLMVLGGFFCFVAGLGLLRLGDIFMRMHAATKAGTLGLALIGISAMLLSPGPLAAVEPLVVFLFMIATSPVGAHLIGRAAFRTGIVTAPHTKLDPGCELFRAEAEQQTEKPAGVVPMP